MPSVEERFWPKVDVRGPEDCWVWLGARGSRGYGNFYFEGRVQSAHRVGWIITNGPISADMDACHRCDNPPCVNPSHIFIGTASDNIMDAQRKGRMPQTQIGQSRKTHCKYGHLLTPENIYKPPAAHPNYRTCRECGNRKNTARRAKVNPT